MQPNEKQKQKALDRLNYLSVKLGLHCLDNDLCHCPQCCDNGGNCVIPLIMCKKCEAKLGK